MKGWSSLLSGLGFGLPLAEPFLQRIVCLANAVQQQSYVDASFFKHHNSGGNNVSVDVDATEEVVCTFQHSRGQVNFFYIIVMIFPFSL